MFVILMGAQGSGKGTQAALLGPKRKLVKIATGDLFRAAITARSELGLEVEAILARGDLVPDDLTSNIVRERVASIVADRDSSDAVAGALFDGFPRTESQARSLDDMLTGHGETVTAVVEIDVPREILIERLSGRRVCDSCGAVYQLQTSPPVVAKVCDRDGGNLIQRDDDQPEAIARRLEHYDRQTAPLLAYYGERNLVFKVDGNQSVDEVALDIEGILASLEINQVWR
ncbi:MAG: adenylate kinase [Thermomicrobiales bacterium]